MVEVNTFYDIEYPMFFKNKELVSFCKANVSSDWVNYCVSHIDLIDLSADLWKLSPILRERYKEPIIIESPTFGKGFFEGWHNLLKDIRNELKAKGINIT